MKNIKIYKNEEDALFFILNQFITTHGMDECKNIYDKELKLSKRLINKLNDVLQKGDEQ